MLYDWIPPVFCEFCPARPHRIDCHVNTQRSAAGARKKGQQGREKKGDEGVCEQRWTVMCSNGNFENKMGGLYTYRREKVNRGWKIYRGVHKVKRERGKGEQGVKMINRGVKRVKRVWKKVNRGLKKRYTVVWKRWTEQGMIRGIKKVNRDVTICEQWERWTGPGGVNKVEKKGCEKSLKGVWKSWKRAWKKFKRGVKKLRRRSGKKVKSGVKKGEHVPRLFGAIIYHIFSSNYRLYNLQTSYLADA